MVVTLLISLFKFIVQNFRMVNPKPPMGSSQSNYLVNNVQLIIRNLRASEFLDDQLTSRFEFVLTEGLRILLPTEVPLYYLICLHGSKVILLYYVVPST
jgi:hypothetical protein